VSFSFSGVVIAVKVALHTATRRVSRPHVSLHALIYAVVNAT
jgi:hypothetical protein